MEVLMNKADKICITIIVICSILFYVPLWWIQANDSSKVKEVVVSYKSKELLRVDLAIDKTYEVKGTMGVVKVKVKNEQVRVEKENSPQNLCSIQGWVDNGNQPIVCLPNNIVVQIESKDASGDDVVIW